MKLKRIELKIILTVLLFFLSSVVVNAGFGVSPAEISNQYLKPGLSFTREFTISRSGSLEEMDIYIEPDLGDIDSWFSYQPGQKFKFSQGVSTMTFKMLVNVPQGADFKDYNGVVRVRAVPSNQDIKGVSITQGIRLEAGLIVTEQDVKKLNIQSIKVPNIYKGQEVGIDITGENQGNVEVSPKIKASVMSLQMEVLEEHEVEKFGTIYPNETSKLTAKFKTDLPPGEYFVEVEVLLDEEVLRKEKLVFRISEKTEEEEEETKASLISRIGDFLRRNRKYIMYISLAILLAIILEILTYRYSQKFWERKDLQKYKEKPWAILLGSKAYSRAALSFAVGFVIFISALLYPFLTLQKEELEEINMGEAQGIQDVTIEEPSFNVFPPTTVQRYLIYEQANNQSKIIYEASEDESFDVVEETTDWYKIRLSDNTLGWLEKSTVKSTSTESR